MSDDEFTTPLLEPSDVSRIKTVTISIVASMIPITVIVGSLIYAMQPDWGAAGAYAAGLFVGFWISPLAGGVAGNGIHEARLAKLEAEKTAPGTEGHPLHAAA